MIPLLEADEERRSVNILTARIRTVKPCVAVVHFCKLKMANHKLSLGFSAIAENSTLETRTTKNDSLDAQESPLRARRANEPWTQSINKAWRARLDKPCSSNSAVRANVRSSDGIGPESFWIVSRPVVIALFSKVFNV